MATKKDEKMKNTKVKIANKNMGEGKKYYRFEEMCGIDNMIVNDQVDDSKCDFVNVIRVAYPGRFEIMFGENEEEREITVTPGPDLFLDTPELNMMRNMSHAVCKRCGENCRK